MFYNNPLIYINSNINKKNNSMMLEQINSYRFLSKNFIQEVEEARKRLNDKDNIEIFCILGNLYSIKNIEEEVKSKINEIFKKLSNNNIKALLRNLQKDIENDENNITNRFCDLYIKGIIEENLKFPKMTKLELSNRIVCLILYYTSTPQEEKENEVNSVMQTFLKKEKPFFMGRQIMIQSFLLEDIKDRKILAVLPDIEGEWYALLEGGIKLYLNNNNPYQREKVSSKDVGIRTTLELESILNNPCYTIKKFFVPYELFEEWNNVFLYALATLPIEYEEKKLELLYTDFLEFIENNICYVEEVEKEIIPKDIFIEVLITSINNIKGYLKGKEELGVSKNILILLKSRYSYLTTIYKIIEKYYPGQVKERTNFTQFSIEKWKKLLERIEDEQNSYDKGISLEDVADYFINCIEGLRVTKRRAKTENEEIDLVCCNVSENSELWKLGPAILIECKNWKEKVDTKVIRNLSYIMDKKGISALLLFIKNDVTNGAKVEIEKQAAHNKFILLFNLQELYEIDNDTVKPIDLLILKLKELENDICDKMENLM